MTTARTKRSVDDQDDLGGGGFPVHAKIVKADIGKVAGNSERRSYVYEDEFEGMYGPSVLSQGLEILEPPFHPKLLESKVQTNNTLSVCVSAIVANVHCTGYDIVATDPENEDEELKKRIEAFFEEPYPGQSFRIQRKQLGKDQERTGNAYLEVVRTLDGQIMFLRPVDVKMTRLVRLGDAHTVPMTIDRGQGARTINLPVRYRRYAQMLNDQAVLYFKPFGCPLHLNSRTGEWAKPGEIVPLNERASEILHFIKDEDSLTPYGVPGWISQMPSVIGSRKAEEMNLDYFDAGGVPPIMVFVHGGALTAAATESLREYLHGGSRNKHTVPVIEAISTSGSMEMPGSVKITVERFGSERQNDSMFEGYDDKCEKRVRRAWRLPPLFVGMAQDYSFATAYASYTVAEAQVFAPERQEFDEIINRTIMRELDPEGLYEYRSKPVMVRDVENQLKALELAVRSKTISREQLVSRLNEITGLNLQLEEDDLASADAAGDAAGPGGPDPNDPFSNVSALFNDPAATATGNDQSFVTDDPGGIPQATGLSVSKTALGAPVRKAGGDIGNDLAHAAFDVFRYGAEGSVIVRLLADIRRLGTFDREQFRSTLVSLATEQVYDPSAGPEFADSVHDVVLGLIEGQLRPS